jgi:hypothetical protein
METVFDHNLSPEEIEDFGFLDSLSLEFRHGLGFPDPLTEQSYRNTITLKASLFDLGLLYYHRGDEVKSEQYWATVADKALQYKLGFDYLIIPSENEEN